MAIEVVLKTIGLLTCELYLKWNDKSIKWSELEFHGEVKSRPVSYRNDVELGILLDQVVSGEAIVNTNRSLVESDQDSLSNVAQNIF